MTNVARPRAAGFAGIQIERWRIYKIDDAPGSENTFAGAFIRTRKPAVKSGCGPECCS